ncbi:MAG: hypothetical protein Q7S22_05565 [Candidatus Micrarchaeota archaeon]|nr:hypothetical protein [Candidatus Micrarchaeota archaeon]
MSIDTETKLKLYMLIVSRYKDLIAKQEEQNITELRQRCSPYTDFIKNLKDQLIARLPVYDYKTNFSQALPLILDYIESIHNFELSIPFWMSFEEIVEIKAAHPMDKAILLTALLRAIDTPNVKVLLAKNKRVFVSFEHKNVKHIIIPETCSTLSGEDMDKILKENSLEYEFNDLIFETYQE